jgi:hypothetical protein
MNDLYDTGQQDEDALEHPAHELAYSTWLGAEELRTYLDPGSGFPLTNDDRVQLLLRIQQVIEELAAGVSYIYQATSHERASVQIGMAVDGLMQACEHLQDGRTPLYSTGDDPGAGEPVPGPAVQSQPDTRSPQALAAEDFPRAPAADSLGPRPGSTARQPPPPAPGTTSTPSTVRPRRSRGQL